MLLGVSASVRSEEMPVAEPDIDENFERLKSERDNATDEIEQSFRSLEQEREFLKREVEAQRMSLEEADLKYTDIDNKYSEIVENLKFTNEKREEIIGEYRLYRHQERAKVVFPIILAAVAYSMSNRAGGDRIVDGFAGYGAAAALETVGMGLGKPIGMLTFKITEWN
jgi:hypothetical protein